MATAIQAPLAAQLFSLGSASNVGNETQYKGNPQSRPHGFRSAGMLQPQGEGTEGERGKAIGNVAGTALSMYLGSQSGAAPTSEAGNGYGLGGNLVSGDMGNSEYAGTQQASLFNSAPEAAMPADNGYKSASPYALDYSNGTHKKPSLFNYSGSYGGATY